MLTEPTLSGTDTLSMPASPNAAASETTARKRTDKTMLTETARSSAPPRPARRKYPKLKFILTFLAAFVVLLAVIGGIKGLQIFTMVKQGEPPMPPTTITSATAREENWAPELSATGSVVAVQGAVLSAELPGTVADIPIQNGGWAEKDAVILKLDASSEEAQLRSAQADLELAHTALNRARDLSSRKVISQSELDGAEAAFKQKEAQVANMRALIDKKYVRAPFAGQVGIRLVNVGQTLTAGQQVVPLQSLDPLFVNFALPQQRLDQLKEGLPVRVTSDAVPGHEFRGKLTTINPGVDEVTRNVQLQATFENPEHLLKPGMFVKASVILPQREKTLVVPATAISYAPYGDSVYVIEKKQDEKTRREGLVLRQAFIRTGETRGDFVAVTNGLKAGDQVAGTGVFKLRNGASVVIDNKLAPNPQENPKPPNT